MRSISIFATAGLATVCSIGFVQAQQPNRIQGTPNSVFPYAAPNEVQIINGVPCRTATADTILCSHSHKTALAGRSGLPSSSPAPAWRRAARLSG